MARQRRHDQHARLRRVDVLGEMQQLAERQVERDLLDVTGTSRLPTRTASMPKSGRVWVSSKREIISSAAANWRPSFAEAPERPFAQPTACRRRSRAQRRDEVVLELVGPIEHRAAPLPAQSTQCKKASAIFAALREDCRGCRRSSGEARHGWPSATLTISSKNYSSWSLRGWLLCRMAGLDFEEQRGRPRRPGHAAGTAAAVALGAGAAADPWRRDGVGHAGDRRISGRDRARRPGSCRPTARRGRIAGRCPARCIRASTICARRCR